MIIGIGVFIKYCVYINYTSANIDANGKSKGKYDYNRRTTGTLL